MSPSSLARLRGILSMMDANERTVLRNYLSCFESRKKGHKPKTLVLFDLLQRHADDAKVDVLMRKKVPTADARRMILTRLTEKALTSLTLDINMSRTENYDSIGQTRVQVAQGKVTAQVLIGRGQRETGLRELDRSIKRAKTYELFHDLVEMLLIKGQYAPRNTPREVLKSALDEIEYYSQCRDAEVRARLAFDEVTRQYGFKGLSRAMPEPERVAYVTARSKELETAFMATDAATVGYYYYLLQIERLQLIGELEAASEYLHGLVQMVENNPSIRNRVRLATSYANLGGNELWMHRFESAERYFNDALVHLRPNSRNHALITEYLFYAQFYGGKLSPARDTLASILSNREMNQDVFTKAVRNYLMACVQFAMGNHASVRKFLSKSQGLAGDKEGWNIGSRTLGIMNSIELEDFDHADSLITNLRQFVREGLKGTDIRVRDRLIIGVLSELRKQSYDFKNTLTTCRKEIERLSSADGETAWHVQTPELVCFHQWFKARTAG